MASCALPAFSQALTAVLQVMVSDSRRRPGISWRSRRAGCNWPALPQALMTVLQVMASGNGRSQHVVEEPPGRLPLAGLLPGADGTIACDGVRQPARSGTSRWSRGAGCH